MLIESLGVFCVVGIVVTAMHVFRTPEVKDIAPYMVRPRQVTIHDINDMSSSSSSSVSTKPNTNAKAAGAYRHHNRYNSKYWQYTKNL